MALNTIKGREKGGKKDKKSKEMGIDPNNTSEES